MNLYEYEARVLDMVRRSVGLPVPPPPGCCPECLEPRPDDERVANGIKCAQCSYGVPQGGR